MRWTQNPAAAVPALVALVVAPGCSGSGSSPTTTTSSTIALDIKKVVLLTPADVPGSEKIAVSAEQDFDFSTCFPRNPFARPDPTDVKNPGLQLTDGSVVREYSSALRRRGTAEQAKAFVTGAASPAGSACMVDAFKRAVAEEPTTPKFDASTLTGNGASVKVADGGALLSISGHLKGGEGAVFTEADLLVFSKGGAVVYVSASAVGGPKVPGQAAELAQKLANRLP